ncbi:MAG: DUF3552 domain-containing protein, partial [Clostridiales bacterium]|nr:DUF3552 domain-containing protein [Clostridiales bacterium]
KKEKLLEAKDENHRYRTQLEDELKDRRTEVQKSEHRLNQREDTLDRRDDTLDRKEQSLADREANLNKRQQQLDEREQDISSEISKQHTELERIAGKYHHGKPA